MNTERKSFPKGFVWGASTAAHQIEGGNHNDWSEWENENARRLAEEAPAKFREIVPDWDLIKVQATSPQNYISGQATNHFNLYREDIALMKQLGLKAFRFSIEWSRIEPKKGEWDMEVFAHYKNVIDELKKNDIEPWVTIWHRTNPVWVAEAGGWENEKTVGCYLKYVEKSVEALGNVKFWMPLNEPMMSLSGGYLGGVYPPGKRSIKAAIKVFRNMVAAHRGAYNIIHQTIPDACVGIPHAAVYTEAYKGHWYNMLLVRVVDYLVNWRFLDAIKNQTDFIGVQYYTRGLLNINLLRRAKVRMGLGVEGLSGVGPEVADKAAVPIGGNKGSVSLSKNDKFWLVEEIHEGDWNTDMGWEVYPPGVYYFIKKLSARYTKPIYITENGMTDASDLRRVEYIEKHLLQIQRAISEGADVRGYFYWSFLDNLEWDKGFWPRFGLVEVDYKNNFKRTVRKSAYRYAEIIKNNAL